MDWDNSRDWENVRQREKSLKELKKAAKGGALGNVIGDVGELRASLAVAEDALVRNRTKLAGFQVVDQYRELQEEATALTLAISEAADENTLDARYVEQLQDDADNERPPDTETLARVYEQAGISLPGVALARYDEVRAFHDSVVRNRQSYLEGELASARARMAQRQARIVDLDSRRATVMEVLRAGGALETFKAMQSEVGRQEAHVEALRQRFEAAEQLES
nr:hypothetical protein [Micromonospora sp. DSM 115978]